MNFTVTFLFIISIFTEIAREVCFKLGADKTSGMHSGLSYLPNVLELPIVWLGFLLWAIEIIAWINVLARVSLSIAFPIMSLCYVGTALAGKFILKEKVCIYKWIGVTLITIGVAIIGSI